MQIVIEDTRNKIHAHDIKHRWFEAHGIELIRCKLIVGDYSSLKDVYIDTKASMQEIAQNIGNSQDHKRFRNELQLAKAFDKHLYILVENLDGIRDLEQVQYWQNPRLAESPQAITGERLYKAMNTIQDKYGCTFLFCNPNDAGKIIVNLLNADI